MKTLMEIVAPPKLSQTTTRRTPKLKRSDIILLSPYRAEIVATLSEVTYSLLGLSPSIPATKPCTVLALFVTLSNAKRTTEIQDKFVTMADHSCNSTIYHVSYK
jgi:hypothetical protein